MAGPFYHFASSLVSEAVEAASITASTAGTAITIVTCTTDHKVVLVTNDLDTPVWLTYDGVKVIRLPAAVPFALDLAPALRELRSGKIIGVYHDGAAPTSGKINVMVS